MDGCEDLLYSLLELENLSGADFVAAACGLAGADHLLLFAPLGVTGHQLVLNTPLPPAVEQALQDMTLRPEESPGLFPCCGSLRLLHDPWTVLPFSKLFPEVRWALIGGGESWDFCALFLGRGEGPRDWIGDRRLAKAMLKRLSDQVVCPNRVAESVSEILMRLSHEFKTPLVSIKGYAELILDQDEVCLDPRVRDWVRRIAGGANRLASLFRKATSEARTDCADSYEARPVDAVEWVRRCVDEVSTLASRRALRWSYRSESEIPRVRVDPEAAHDMLVELLQNAARATPDGGEVSVQIRSSQHEREPGVLVSVEDTGIGIPLGGAGLQVFERFATLRGVMGHHSGEFEYGAAGLGLGLSMASGVAKAHGGALWVECRGRDEKRLPGSVFHLWLPLFGDTATSFSDAEADLRGRLLLVDPDPQVCHILQNALTPDYEVVGVSDAEEALTRWAREEWQGCIVEPRIPGGGVVLIRHLKAQSGRESAAILTYSTDAGASETASWRAAGADSCIGKPARSRVLLQRLRTVRAKKILR